MKSVNVVGRALQDKLFYQDVVMVEINLAYPAIAADRPERCALRFNRYYEREACRQLREARNGLYHDAVAQYIYAAEHGYPFNAYTLMQTFEVTCNGWPILSLYLDAYRYTGGAHGTTDRTGNTWNLHRCKMLCMADLFRRGYDYTAPIFRYVEAEAVRRQAAGEADYFDDLARNIRASFDESNFFLSCGGLNVYYPLYSIAPYVAGIQVFTVPWGMFGNNLVYPPDSLCAC